MNLDPKHCASPEQPSTQVDAGSKGLSRRAALKLGAGAAPILMTLASRSAFACHSTTPSAFGSINASRPDNNVSLSGRSPDYWADEDSNWPSGCYKRTTRNRSASTLKGTFGAVCGTFTNTTTLLDVLQQSNCTGANAVARACVAAHFNALMGYTSAVLPASAVRIMFQEFAATGHYTPTAGVTWYADTPLHPQVSGGGITGYLRTTWY